ncbi:MAG: glycosyltransferase family 2 protein [Lachnospiraceae bacterium]|nr:glycosyltransferase family 2 protein [Lachnospiraceae bacterium]
MITASVVLFHTKQTLIDTIIESYGPAEDRLLFLVDNSPEEGADQGFGESSRPYVYIHHTGRNTGYGSGHNIAIREAVRLGSSYHVVLNPDLSFSPQVIDALASYATDHSDVVYMLPEVIDQNGELQHLCKLLPRPSDLILRRFFPHLPGARKKNDRYVLLDKDYDKIMNPPCLSGCFMFLRVETIKKYSLYFDQRFFMYCEDFDLIRRLHRVGKTIYYPMVTITHIHERGSYHSIRMLCHHLASAIRYFNKYGWIRDPERDRMNEEITGQGMENP